MSEMIERVATAIRNSSLGVMLTDEQLNLAARAAIEEMREPTDEMKFAMAPWSRTTGHHEGVWIAGIDAALK
jgi:hypothetical protein